MNRGERKQAEEARSWLAAIVESSDYAVVGTTPEGVITSWNSGAKRLYGYTPQEAIGRSISVLTPPNRPEEMQRVLERIERGERLDRYETVHACNDGRQLEVSIALSPVRGSEDSVLGAWAIVRGLTERKRDEERLRILAEASRAFAEAVPDYETLLQVVAERISEATGDACTVRLLSDDGRWLRPVAGHHPDPELKAAIWAVMEGSARWSDSGLWQTVVKERRTVRASVSPREALPGASEAQAEFMRRHQMCAIMGAPLVARGRIAGGISLVRYGHQAPYTEDDETFLRDLALRAALAIDNARLYDMAEEELAERRESEEKYRGIFENAREAICQITRDGRILTANPAMARIFGYETPEELMASVSDAGHQLWADLEDREEYVRRVMERGSISDFETTMRCKDGTPIDVSINAHALSYSADGELEAIEGTIEDVTARKRAEEIRRRLAAIVKSSEDAIIGKTLDGIITDWNDAARRLYGYSAEEAIGRHISILAPPDYSDEIADILRRIGRGERVSQHETVRVTKDGRRLYISLSVAPIEDAAGNVVGASTIARDTTERKLAERRLQNTLERLLALYEGGQVLGTSLQREEIGLRLLETMHRASDLSGAVIELTDERGVLRELCTTGDESLLQKTRSTQAARGARRKTLESGERESFGLRLPSSAGEAPLLAGLCLPLRVRDRLIGIVEAYSPAENLLEQETVEMLSGLANQGASALGNAHLYEELAERERRLRELVGQILKAQEEERRRVAYEVHDGLAQVAAAAHQYLQGFAKRYTPESASGKEELKEALDLIQQAVREARQIIADLRPTALDDFGLRVALRMHAEELSAAEDLQVSFEESLGDQRLPQEAETTLYRIAQEALTNARKHARSPRAHVKLERLNGSVRLEVRDWGRGFKVGAATNGGGGPGERVGISGMRERASLLGGELKIESRPGAGTSVVAEVPLAQKEEADGER